MRKNKLAPLFLFALSLLTQLANAQNSNRNFETILQTYYLLKDKDILEKTVEFANNPGMEYERFSPIMIGFFGPLFLTDKDLKKNFIDSLDRFNNQQIKSTFLSLDSLNIDSVYKTMKVSPTYNDMNWASYFATGDTKYLDNIIANLPFNEERIDINLFVTGASAKWSLSSNARQDEKVNTYITSLK